MIASPTSTTNTDDTARRRSIAFLNIANGFDHFILLIYPTVVIGLEAVYGRPYSELIALSTTAFVAFGLFSLPAGWIGDHWSRRNMLAILIAHAKVERFEDPENSAYDRYTPRLHKHAASLVSEWVDAVFFATRRYRVQKESAGFSGERGIASPIGADGGERILRTVGGPACVAKNRFNLPAELPLSWDAFMTAMAAGGDR